MDTTTAPGQKSTVWFPYREGRLTSWEFQLYRERMELRKATTVVSNGNIEANSGARGRALIGRNKR